MELEVRADKSILVYWADSSLGFYWSKMVYRLLANRLHTSYNIIILKDREVTMTTNENTGRLTMKAKARIYKDIADLLYNSEFQNGIRYGTAEGKIAHDIMQGVKEALGVKDFELQGDGRHE